MPEPQNRFPAVLLSIAVVGAVATGLAVAVGAVAGRAVVNRLLHRDQGVSIETSLVAASQAVNKTCPQMVDSETRLDNTYAGLGKSFYYRYTLVNLTKADVDPKALTGAMRPTIVNNFKTNPAMKSMREAGVVAHYQYSDKSGVFITDVIVGPADLK